MACRSSSRRLCSGESTKRKRSLRQERHSLGQVLRNELRMSRVIFSRIARLLPGAPFLPLPRGSDLEEKEIAEAGTAQLGAGAQERVAYVPCHLLAYR